MSSLVTRARERVTRRGGVGEVRVDDTGISATSAQEAVLDLLVDGRRIFSFWLHRDGVREGRRWLVAWPRTLREFLDGSAVVSVVVHTTGEVLFRERVRLGGGVGAIEIVRPRDGQPLSLDKSWRRVVTFDTRSPANREPLLDAIELVLAALAQAGLEAFPAYGTLLGAVREGRVLGHDSDADLGYVSRHTHPVDAILESFRVQRDLQARGLRVMRYSALAFKVDVDEGDGVVRGLDVFGGFLMGGHLHLMGELRVPYEREWIFPLGRTRLEGRELPAPADPERLLAATYGPSWRVPDPAFKFETPPSTYRRLNGWFRGQREGHAPWDRSYSGPNRWVPAPSGFVQWVAAREPGLATYVDVGCGRGADVLWLARRGVAATGLDFTPRAFERAAAKGVEGARFETVNLLELRQLLPAGAAIARLPGPRVIAARHLVDAVDAPARHALWRLAAMGLAGGGQLALETLAHAGDDGYAAPHRVRERRPEMIVAELEALGARVAHTSEVPVSAAPGASVLARVVADFPATVARAAASGSTDTTQER